MMQAIPLGERYRFLKRLATGRNRTVWLAEDISTGRMIIAVRLPPRFGRLLAPLIRVRHPHLASLLDLVRDAGREELPNDEPYDSTSIFAVAEWVSGRTLYDALLQEALPPVRAVQTVAYIASAVAALHARKAFHGEISARSVVLERADGGPEPALTQVVMSPDGSYASPERLAGEGPGQQDDVWALHVLLYASLTGKRPFRARSRQELIDLVASRPPLPLDVLGVGDNALQRIIDRGFDRDRSQRTTSIHALETALFSWMSANAQASHVVSATPDQAEPSAVERDAFAMVRKAEAGAPWANERGESTGQALSSPSERQVDTPLDSRSCSAGEQRSSDMSPPSLAKHPAEVGDVSAADVSVGDVSVGDVSVGDVSVGDVSAATARPALISEVEKKATAPSGSSHGGGLAKPRSALPSRRSMPVLFAGAALLGLLLIAGVGTFFLHRKGRSVAAPTPIVAHARVAVARSAPVAPHGIVSAAAGPPLPASSPVFSSHDRADRLPPKDVSSCVARHFTPETFAIAQDLAFICDQPDPRKGATTMRIKIVLGSGRKLSGGMKMWPRLGWHELLVYGLLRRRCCPGSPPITLPPPREPGRCTSLGETINTLSTAFMRGQADLEPAHASFVAAATCALRTQDRAYHYRTGPLSGGQLSYKAFIERNASR